MSGDYLTMTEIEAKYPGEWILLAEAAFDSHGDITGGRLLVHHGDRAVFESQAESIPPNGLTILRVYDRHAEPVWILTPFLIEDDLCDTDSTLAVPTSTSTGG